MAMMGEFSLFVTSVTSAGSQLSFHAQLNLDKVTALNNLISQNQAYFEQSTLSSPLQLQPGEVVLVKSVTGGAAKWHRGRVVGIHGLEYGTVSVQYIDYGTSELAHYSQICASRSAVTSHILSQPPLAVQCVLAEVVPALGTWSDAALTFVESKLRAPQPIQAQLLRQDPEGVWHVRVFTSDGSTVASQLVALGLGRLASSAGQPSSSLPSSLPYQETALSPFSPPAGGSPVLVPARPARIPSPVQYPIPPAPAPPVVIAFATRVKELTSVPPPPGSEALVTICHYISGPAKFAIQLHDQQPALRQLMKDIQSYCQSNPAVPLSAVESGVVCLGSSASREGRFLRGVITQADGNVVKVYWADYGNDETKVASELRCMPRQFAELRIQASRVSLAGLAALTPVQGRPEPLFRQMTEGSVLTGRFAKPRDQPAASAGGSVCLNQVELLDMGVSILDLLIRAGAYERRSGSTPTPSLTSGRRSASPPADPPPLTSGTHAEVRVVSVTSVSSLHVRPLETEPRLQRLLERLTDSLNISACPLAVDKAAEGVVCAAFKDASYQRARIMSVGRKDMKVLYIDLGTSEIIPTGSAFALEPALATYPPQAVHCCLSGLEMSHGTPELVNQLRTLTSGGRLLCEVLDQLGEKRIVRLTDLTRSPPLDVGASLRGMMSTGRRVQTSLSTAPAAVQKAVAVTVKPPEVVLGRAELISVVHVESAESFFGQLMSLDADAMYAMEEALQTRYGAGKVTPLKPAHAGAFCVAKSTINETFYRAKVLSAATDKVTIQYIDYGDRETKAPTEVFPLQPEFTKLPQMGVFCCLAGGDSVPADTFSRLVQDQTVDVLPVFGSGDHYRITLPASPENLPLLAQLKPFGVKAAAPTAIPKSPAAVNGKAASPTSPRKASPAVISPPGPVDVPPLQLPIGLFKDVSMSHVVTPSEFYVRLREHCDALARLEAEMATYAAEPPAPVTVGQAVAVETVEQWRRGRVTERRVDQVSVYLLDGGETVSAPLSAVRRLRSEHARLPAQAVRCCAKGARPASGNGWTDEETAKFRSGVSGRSFLARAEELSSDSALVTLAQAELVRPGALLTQGTCQLSPQPADSNNNTKRGSPSSRADQEVLQAMLHTITCSGSDGGVETERKLKVLDIIIKDRNWRDKTTAAPAPATVTTTGPSTRRPSESRLNGGLRAAERRPSGGSAPAQRPPRPDPARRAAPAGDAGPDLNSEPTLERFAGKMRMDDPAEYAPVTKTSSGGWPASQSNNNDDDWGAGDVNKAVSSKAKPPTPTPAPAKVEIPPHTTTIARQPLPPGTTLTVTPTWVSGLGRFYVQRCPPEPAFTKLMEELQRFYGGLKGDDGKETQPEPGKPVAARFTDGGWYRAAVRSASPAELRVLFVDYGNCEMVPRPQVKRLKEEHCRMPAQAYCCQFAGVEPVGGQWKTLDEKQLAKYFSGDMKVRAVEGGSGSVSAVEVTLAGQKVTDLLVADGLAARPEPGGTVKQEHLGPFRPLPHQFHVGDTFPAFVTYIGGPDRLYCQLVVNSADIEQMETEIETAAGQGKPVGAAAAGAGCLAPFDGTFYRGVVVKPARESASVHFIDYGNTETAPVAELLECPESLRRLPAQAVRLALPGVAPDRTEELTARADQMELVVRVEALSSDHLEVTLLDGTTNINQKLGGSSPAPSPAPAAAPAPTPAPAPAAAPAPTDAPKKVTFAPTEDVLPAPAAMSECRQVSVSFTVSPGEFYVQDAAAADQLDELMNMLETEYTQLGEGERAVTEVQSGDLLAAPFSEDGAFYRARVLSSSEDTSQLHLQFIDYGNTEWSALTGCRLLTPPLLAPAPFAQRCRLAAAAPPDGGWTDDATAVMEAMTGAPDGQVTMTVVEKEGECWSVRMTGLGGEHVAEALVKGGHAAAKDAKSTEEDTKPTEEDTKPAERDAKPTEKDAKPTEDTKPTEKDAKPTEEDTKPTEEDVKSAGEDASAAADVTGLLPGRPVAAAVAFSLGPCEFWAQLLADSARLDSLMETLEEAGEMPVADSPAVGTLVAVRYAEDRAMYRARVLPDSDSESESRRVLFVDYGNTELVPAAELRCLPAELATEAPLALRCSLALRPTEGAELAAVDRFAELADGELELELTLLKAGDPMMVTLTHEGRDLAKVLVEEGLATAVPLEVRTQPETKETEASQKAEIPKDEMEDTKDETERGKSHETDPVEKQVTSDDNHEKTDAPSDETLNTSPLEDPGDHEVFVSHVNSPLDFFVQSPDTTDLDELMDRLAAADPSQLSPVSGVPDPSDILAAPFSEDESLYRARVLSVSDGVARVQFVDYGNGEEVELTALRQLPAGMEVLPPQALRCRLMVEACAAAAGDRLREVTESGALLTRLAASSDAEGPVALVRLTADGRDVAETLAADGLCRPSRRVVLPPALPPRLDTDITARVTYVEDGGEVYLVPASDETALGELRAMTAELYSAQPPPALDAPSSSDLCVVGGPDGGWRRAVVLSVNPSATAVLRLVDSGATLEAPLAQLRQPVQAVALPPPLAHRCRLAPGPDGRVPSPDQLREACRSADGVMAVRLTVSEGQLMAQISLDDTPTELTEQPAGDEATESLIGDETTPTGEEATVALEAEEPTEALEGDEATPTGDKATVALEAEEPTEAFKDDEATPTGDEATVTFESDEHTESLIGVETTEVVTDDGATEDIPTVEVTELTAETSGDATDGTSAEDEAPAAPAVISSPRRRSHDDIIVPGQLSFVLIGPSKLEQTPADDLSDSAGKPHFEEVTESKPESVTEDRATPKPEATLETESPSVKMGTAACAVGSPAVTPRGRHLSHEYKIVPGQISFSLITDPEQETEKETTRDAVFKTRSEADDATTIGDTKVKREDEMTAAPEDVTETKPDMVESEVTSKPEATPETDVTPETEAKAKPEPEATIEAEATRAADATSDDEATIATDATSDEATQATDATSEAEAIRAADATLEDEAMPVTEATPETDARATPEPEATHEAEVTSDTQATLQTGAMLEAEATYVTTQETKASSETGTTQETMATPEAEVTPEAEPIPEIYFTSETDFTPNTEASPVKKPEAGTTVAAAGPPAGTPVGRHVSHEYKIVPGQISFSLLREPEEDEEGTTAEERAPGEIEVAQGIGEGRTSKDAAEAKPEDRAAVIPEDEPIFIIEEEVRVIIEDEVTPKPQKSTAPETDATPGTEHTSDAEAVCETGASFEDEAKDTPNAEAIPEVTPEPEDTEADVAPENEATIRTETSPETEIASEARATLGTEATLEAEATLQTEATPEIEAVPVTEVMQEAEAIPVTLQETYTSSELETTQESEATPKAETTSEAETTLETEATDSEDTSEDYSTPETDLTSEAEATPETETTYSDTDATPETEISSENEVLSETEASSEIEANSDAESTLDTETTSEAEDEGTPETENTPEAEAVPEAEAETTPKAEATEAEATPLTKASPGAEAAPEAEAMSDAEPTEAEVTSAANASRLEKATPETEATLEAEATEVEATSASKAASETEASPKAEAASPKADAAIEVGTGAVGKTPTTTLMIEELVEVLVMETVEDIPETTSQATLETTAEAVTETVTAAVTETMGDAVTVISPAVDPAAEAIRINVKSLSISPQPLAPISEDSEQDQSFEESAEPSEETIKPSKEIAKSSDEPARISEETEKSSGEPGKSTVEPTKLLEEISNVSETPVKLPQQSANLSEEPVEPSEELVKLPEEPVEISEEPIKCSEEPIMPPEEPTRLSKEPVRPSEESLNPSEEPTKYSEEHAEPSKELVKPSEDHAKTSEEPVKSFAPEEAEQRGAGDAPSVSGGAD